MVTITPLDAVLGAEIHGVYISAGVDDSLMLALTEALYDYRVIVRHKYSVGDLVVWDTLQTMHATTPIDIATAKEDSRLLWRISVRGRPAVHAAAA